MLFFINFIPVKDFILSHREFVYYLISVDLHKNCNQYLNPSITKNTVIEIKSLEFSIHYSSIISIKYKAVFGFGFELPKIKHQFNNGL